MADWNEDIRGRKITNFINKLELKEAILSRHGTTHAPSTYIEGSTPIDGIFTTRGISIQGSGYLACGVKGKPDHRAAWIDVTMTSTLGYKIPETIWPSMQRVTTKDMRSVKEFNKAMRAFVLRHQLGERITKLRGLQSKIWRNQLWSTTSGNTASLTRHLRCVCQYNGSSDLIASHQQEREYWMVLTHQPQAQTDTADSFKNSDAR
jgi:hypothetical protein